MSGPVNSPTARLVADVGGTNTRIALFNPTNAKFHSLSLYKNSDFARLEDLIDHWLDTLGESPPTTCCLAVAAPPSGDQVVMCNMDWSFSCNELATRFGFRQLLRLNDFEANAYALPHLASGDQIQLQTGSGNGSGRLATVGPGTGLGGAFLDHINDVPRSFACEPGHMGLSPGNELELDIFRLLLPRYGNIYAELLVSGPGLARLHQSLGEITGRSADSMDPADISRLAVSGEDELCLLALQTFCGLLGSVCGDFLLASGSYGALYLAGGIAPRLATFIGDSSFHQRLIGKGAMSDMLGAVPVHVITMDYPGLVGAAHAPLR